METNKLLIELQKQIAELRKALDEPLFPKAILENWLPRPKVMEFLNYGSTQMAALEKSGEIIVAKVGKRKFIRRDSLEKMIEKNILRFETH